MSCEAKRAVSPCPNPVMQQLASDVQPPCNGNAIETECFISDVLSTGLVAIRRIPLAPLEDDTCANIRRIQ